jgi:hypothetical protein
VAAIDVGFLGWGAGDHGMIWEGRMSSFR